MTSKTSLAKAALLIGGASILAVAISAQPRQNSSVGGNAGDFDWFTIRYQTSTTTGGTTTGSTGGSGGVITGSTPRPLSEVVVINPTMFTNP